MEFNYDIRDMQFIIKEWLHSDDIFGCDRFKKNYSVSDVDMYLTECYKFVQRIVNPINAPGDEVGAQLENGIVKPAPGFKEVFQSIQKNGWGSTCECLGMESTMPFILVKQFHELIAAACPAIYSYIKLSSGVANLLIRFGTDEDKKKFLPKLLSGDWQGAMCISEPDAGSDVGDSKTRAYPTDDPRIYKIKGTKMFITGGDAGIGENTIHAVLARPEGGVAGSAGIGLYIVPKIWVKDDGTLSGANDVITARLEHKMGLHAQATALLNFGENDACYGIRLGDPPDEKGRSRGVAMMFHMMNESRIGTGLNANSQASAAYCYAANYAKDRIQGRPFGSKGGARVPIIKHEDIRRLLLDMKAHTEGIRALIFKGFYNLDIQENSSDAKRAERCGSVAEVLTPIIKCYASEISVHVISEAMQVFGGVGYTREYPVEQYLRDSKILTIWEGTSFIHANDLIGRKFRMNEGASFNMWMNQIEEFTEQNKNVEGFDREMLNLERGVSCLRTINELYQSWYGDFQHNSQLIPLHAIKFLFICAQVQVAECLMEQALVAKQKLAELSEGHFDKNFYLGKIASARYYVNEILPQAFVATEIMKSEPRTVLDVPEEIFAIR